MTHGTSMRGGTRGALGALLLMSLVGCDGSIGSPMNSRREDAGVEDAGTVCEDISCLPESDVPEASGLARLSHRQWQNSVQDVLGVELPADYTERFADDTLGATYFDNDAAGFVVAPALWEDFLEAAEDIARQVTSSATETEKLTTLYGADAATFVPAFGRRLFRRPLSDAEITRYSEVWALAPELVIEREGLGANVMLTVQAMMQSPHFLYRDERGTPSDTDATRYELDGYALASRLAYTLWDTTPDEELLDAAAAGELDTSEGLRSHAERLLADVRADQGILRFHEQLYQFDLYENRDPLYYEAALAFIDHVVVQNEGGIREILTSPVAYVNDTLAAAYGLEGSYGEELTEIEISDPLRRGLLTQPGFLAAKSGGTAPIHRGVFVTLRVMCVELGAQQFFTEPSFDPSTTRRQQITDLTDSCGATCHRPNINAIGFAFEGFDDLGAVRTHEELSGLPVDTSGRYDFGDYIRAYGDAAEFIDYAAETGRAHRCYARNWLEYAMGRPRQDSDERFIYELGERSREQGLDARSILLELMTSDAFRARRVDEGDDQ